MSQSLRMTPSDFTKWLDGFRAALGNRAPTAEEWALVAEKAASVREGVVVPAGPVLPTSPTIPGQPWPWTVTCGSESQPVPSVDGLRVTGEIVAEHMSTALVDEAMASIRKGARRSNHRFKLA